MNWYNVHPCITYRCVYICMYMQLRYICMYVHACMLERQRAESQILRDFICLAFFFVLNSWQYLLIQHCQSIFCIRVIEIHCTLHAQDHFLVFLVQPSTFSQTLPVAAQIKLGHNKIGSLKKWQRKCLASIDLSQAKEIWKVFKNFFPQKKKKEKNRIKMAKMEKA